jgi:hypothetical protein
MDTELICLGSQEFVLRPLSSYVLLLLLFLVRTFRIYANTTTHIPRSQPSQILPYPSCLHVVGHAFHQSYISPGGAHPHPVVDNSHRQSSYRCSTFDDTSGPPYS